MRARRIASLEQALDVLTELGDEAQILAGGTDVMIQLQRGEIRPSTLVPIEPLSELGTIEVNGKVRLGSLVTHESLARDVLGPGYAAIRESAASVGGWQTQTVGTIGGNICNASPAADTMPSLLVHDAQVNLLSKAGQRSMPLIDFVLGRRQTARRPDELLVSIDLAPASSRSGDTYLKVGRRGAMEIAIVCLSMRLEFAEDGRVSEARVALASVAASPIRVRGAETLLEESLPDDGVAAAAAEAILAEISPIDDLRASARYRRLLVPGLTRRAIVKCAERAGIPIDLVEV